MTTNPLSAVPRRTAPSRRKAIILAGGTGTRLYPLTTAVNKQLLPVYDKPMIYYPLTTLMLAGIREFVVVSGPEAMPQFQHCLGSGAHWGITIEYAVQPRPEGIAQGILVARPFIEGRDIALILGDNIFYGAGLPDRLIAADARARGATVFAYYVADPSGLGVVELDAREQAIALHEKPKTLLSHWAVPGLYFYDADVLAEAQALTPSSRGELEITDLNRRYLARGALAVEVLGRGIAWLDGGTHADLFAASQFVEVMESRTGLKIACPEEVALRMGFITPAAFKTLVGTLGNGSYAKYLQDLAARA